MKIEVEKFVDTPLKEGEKYSDRQERYGNKCPKCNEVGTTNVMPSTGGFWFCENPDCPVNRHFSSGYYITVKSDKKPVTGILKNPDDVQVVSSSGRKKRLVK